MTVRLWLVFALFIVYSTLLPFQFSRDPELVAHKTAVFRLNPLVREDGRRLSIPDAVQNVMLFVPFGVFGALALRGRQRSGGARIAVVAATGVGLSASVETFQLFTVDRIASASDVMTNGIGALAGALLTEAVHRRAVMMMRQHRASLWMTGPWTYVALVALGWVFVAAWQPFDLTLDVSTVAGKLRALWRDPWQRGPVTDEGSATVLYALSVMIVAKWFEATRLRRPWSCAAGATAAIAVCLEASQVLVTSRMPAGSDAAVRLAGVATGMVLLPFANASRRKWPWVWSLFSACTVAAALSAWSPFEISDERQPFAWAPLVGYYGNNWFSAVSHLIELTGTFLPFGFALAWFHVGRRPMFVTLLTTLAAASLVEYGQSWFIGRHPDITDVAITGAGSVLGAWLGGQGSRLFDEARVAAAT